MDGWQRQFGQASLVLALLWAGMVLGVSFLATPVKFLAASLTMPVALDVGQTTFHAFAPVEGVFAVVLVALALLRRPLRMGLLAAALGAALAVAIQALVLLPPLDVRVAQVIAGTPPAPSNLHEIYIGIEVVKLVLILAVAALSMRPQRQGGAARSGRLAPSGDVSTQPGR